MLNAIRKIIRARVEKTGLSSDISQRKTMHYETAHGVFTVAMAGILKLQELSCTDYELDLRRSMVYSNIHLPE